MYNYSHLSRLFTLFSAIALMLHGSLSAQGIDSEMNKALKAMNEKAFDKAQPILSGVIKDFSKGAMVEYGARFGSVYYFKGYSELILAQKAQGAKDTEGTKKWADLSIASFKACYEQFADAADPEKKSVNEHHKKSLQMWATASALNGDHASAVKLYKKFLAERRRGDQPFPTVGNFYANVAVSHYLLETPDFSEGNLYLGKALEDRAGAKTSEGSISKAFLALSSASVKANDEKGLVNFINENRAVIAVEPYKVAAHTPLLLNMASSAIKAQQYAAAYALYSLIPNTEDVIEGLNTKISQLPEGQKVVDNGELFDRAKLKTQLKKVEEKKRAGDPDEVAALMGLAYLNQQAGNRLSSYHSFDTLEKHYKKSKHRESNLFNLVNVSSSVGKIQKTAEYGRLFLDTYPKSKKAEVVRERMLVSLFFRQEYQQSLSIANELIGTLEKTAPSEAHDICLFVKAGSHFYLNQREDAEPYLEKHIKSYPSSKMALHASYYQAANLANLKKWPEATKALQSFVAKYPDAKSNNYLPNAIYYLANAYYADSKYDETLVQVDRLEEEYPRSVLLGRAYNLKGNIYESTDKYVEAEKSYLRALQVAESKKNRGVAAEALNYLVGFLTKDTLGGKPNTRMEDALPHYDKFLKDYSDQPYKAQVLVFGLPAMEKAGRLDEALDNMKLAIVETAATPEQFYLEETVNAYAGAFLKKEGNTPKMLKETLYSLDGIKLSNKRALALIRISVITAYEGVLKKPEVAKNRDKKLAYEADIKALFKDLNQTFNPSELTPYILVRIGDYLRNKTASPKESLPYYNELIKRKDRKFEGDALLGVADVMGSSNNKADKQKAITTLEQVLLKVKDVKKVRGEAIGRLVELYAEQSDWANTEVKGRLYLKESHSAKAAEVTYLVALSFDKRKMTEDALRNYSLLSSRYTGYLRVSAPSVKRVLEILWKRNYPVGKVVGKGDKKKSLKKSDRQSAYEDIGSRYLAQTSEIRSKNPDITNEDKKVWDEISALVKKYENSGKVKTLKEIKAEENRRTR